MVEFLLFGLGATTLFILLHLHPLSEEELTSLANKRRKLKLKSFFSWSKDEIIANPQFKSAMNKHGALHSISLPLSGFPAFGAGLLKSKKHEWMPSLRPLRRIRSARPK